MSVKLIQTNPPPTKTYSWGDPEPFSEYDVKDLTAARVEKCVYWYTTGSYEGSGRALLYRGGAWYHKSLAHCSCYGPLEDLDFSHPILSLSAWLEQSTPEFRAEVQPLIDAIQNEK